MEMPRALFDRTVSLVDVRAPPAVNIATPNSNGVIELESAQSSGIDSQGLVFRFGIPAGYWHDRALIRPHAVAHLRLELSDEP